MNIMNIMHAYGFIGLGNMGAPMAANLAKGGFEVLAYDKAGPERAPTGTRVVASLAEAAAGAEALFLSVPDGAASLNVARELAALDARQVITVIDLSTIGIDAARQVHAYLAETGIAYVDCPVSGGVAGARAATITAMWAGPEQSLAEHRPGLRAIAKNIFQVGDRPGQGQAMKLLNNFLSATAMAATAEAMLFGLSQDLDMKTMLDVVNVSTGRNTATSDKFPNRVLTGTYDAGFYTALMHKDLRLYREGVERFGTPALVGAAVDALWRDMDNEKPHSDISEVFLWLQEKMP